MIFQDVVSPIIVAPLAAFAVSGGISYTLVLVLFIAIFFDASETLLRMRAFAKNKTLLSVFRNKIGGEPPLDNISLSVIVPAYKRVSELKRCLKCLVDSGIPKEQIFVIDDYSNDNFQTATFASAQGVKVISLSRNTKKVGAVNIGLGFVNTKYVLLLDADSLLVANYSQLNKAILEMEKLQLDAMAGMVLPYNPAPESSGHSSNILFGIQRLEYEQAMKLGRGSMYSLDSIQKDNEVSVDNFKVKRAEVMNVSGAFGIFRTEALRKTSDAYQNAEEIFAGEDLERTFKMLATNGKVGYSDELLIYTSSPITVKSHFKQRVTWAEGFFRCFCSRFGAGICRKKVSTLTYVTYLIRDILLHPLKLLFLPLLIIDFPLFLVLLAFYLILNLTVTMVLNGGKQFSKRATFLLSFYRLYLLLIPTTIGYVKGLLHVTKIAILKSNGRNMVPPIKIIKTWNIEGANFA